MGAGGGSRVAVDVSVEEVGDGGDGGEGGAYLDAVFEGVAPAGEDGGVGGVGKEGGDGDEGEGCYGALFEDDVVVSLRRVELRWVLERVVDG